MCWILPLPCKGRALLVKVDLTRGTTNPMIRGICIGKCSAENEIGSLLRTRDRGLDDHHPLPKKAFPHTIKVDEAMAETADTIATMLMKDITAAPMIRISTNPSYHHNNNQRQHCLDTASKANLPLQLHTLLRRSELTKKWPRLRKRKANSWPSTARYNKDLSIVGAHACPLLLFCALPFKIVSSWITTRQVAVYYVQCCTTLTLSRVLSCRQGCRATLWSGKSRCSGRRQGRHCSLILEVRRTQWESKRPIPSVAMVP